MRRPAGVPASAGIVSTSLMALLASGLLVFAWIYSTVHTPTPPLMGVTAMQPTDSAAVLAQMLEVPPPQPATVPSVSAELPARPLPHAERRAAPRSAPRALPRSTAPAHPAAPRWTVGPPPRPKPPVPDNPYDSTATDETAP